MISPLHTPSLLSLWLTDGELYSGVYIDFMGTDSAIFRTLGKQTAMRTDQYNSRWLNGNVSTHGLQPSLFLSLISFQHRPAHRLFLELCRLGKRLLIFPACSTWPHDHLTQSIKCTMLIVDCVPAEPDHKVSSVVAGRNYWMSIMSHSSLRSLMNHDCHSIINAGREHSVDVAKSITVSPSVAGSEILLWPCFPDNSPMVVACWIGTPVSC